MWAQNLLINASVLLYNVDCSHAGRKRGRFICEGGLLGGTAEKFHYSFLRRIVIFEVLKLTMQGVN